MISNNDLTTNSIEWALGALERRSQVTANNVANAETPNFRAGRVEFEGRLRDALGRGEIDRIEAGTITQSNEAPGANGNNVSLEEEMIDMIETNLRKNAMIQAFNYKAGLLRTAMRGQA